MTFTVADLKRAARANEEAIRYRTTGTFKQWEVDITSARAVLVFLETMDRVARERVN
jgi:hypothetical protein